MQIAPDGRALVFSSRWAGKAEVVAIDLPSGTRRVLTDGFRPALSSDGATVFFFRGGPRDETIWALPLAGGEARQIARLTDGFRLVHGAGELHAQISTAEGYRAWRVPLDGGAPFLEAPAPIALCAPSPDGRWWLLRRMRNGAESELVVRAGTDFAEAQKTGRPVTWTDVDWNPRGELLGREGDQIRALDPETGATRDVFPLPVDRDDDPFWALSPDEQTLYRTVSVTQVRRMVVTNFGDRPRF